MLEAEAERDKEAEAAHHVDFVNGSNTYKIERVLAYLQFLGFCQGHTRVLQLYFNLSFWRSNVSEKAHTLRELEER